MFFTLIRWRNEEVCSVAEIFFFQQKSQSPHPKTFQDGKISWKKFLDSGLTQNMFEMEIMEKFCHLGMIFPLTIIHLLTIPILDGRQPFEWKIPH